MFLCSVFFFLLIVFCAFLFSFFSFLFPCSVCFLCLFFFVVLSFVFPFCFCFPVLFLFLAPFVSVFPLCRCFVVCCCQFFIATHIYSGVPNPFFLFIIIYFILFFQWLQCKRMTKRFVFKKVFEEIVWNCSQTISVIFMLPRKSNQNITCFMLHTHIIIFKGM